MVQLVGVVSWSGWYGGLGGPGGPGCQCGPGGQGCPGGHGSPDDEIRQYIWFIWSKKSSILRKHEMSRL